MNEQQLLQRETQNLMRVLAQGLDQLCTNRESREPRPLQHTRLLRPLPPLPPLPPKGGENSDTDAQSCLNAKPPTPQCAPQNNTPSVLAAAHTDVEVQRLEVAATATVNDMTTSEAACSSDNGTMHSAASIPTDTDAAGNDSS